MISYYREADFPPSLPNFYRQCLIALLEVKNQVEPANEHEVLTQRLWFNKHIAIGNKSVYYNHWYMNNIRCIKDLASSDGSFLSQKQLEKKFGFKVLNYLEHMSLIAGIPKKMEANVIHCKN